MKIYVRDYSEENECLFLMKCFRNDIFVEIDNEIYNLFFIEQSRFKEELEISIQEDGYCMPDPNTVIITGSVNRENVILQCNQIGENAIRCMKPCTQKNGRIFLNLSSVDTRVYLEYGWKISVEKTDLTQIF